MGELLCFKKSALEILEYRIEELQRRVEANEKTILKRTNCKGQGRTTYETGAIVGVLLEGQRCEPTVPLRKTRLPLRQRASSSGHGRNTQGGR